MVAVGACVLQNAQVVEMPLYGTTYITVSVIYSLFAKGHLFSVLPF